MNTRPGFFARLKAGLARSAGALGGGIADLFARKTLDEETVAALEEALIRADLGPVLAARYAQAIARGRFGKDVTPDEIRDALAAEILETLLPVARPLDIDHTRKPFVILVAGVNGTGKTTTIGKLARRFAQDGLKVVLAAGDTFRAAAIDQLRIWGARAGARVVAREPGADAAGLVFDAHESARNEGADVLIVDTAGRLQNKAGLMAELDKIARVLRKRDANAPHASLLVLDATTGQNALAQVEAFREPARLTGLVMTKLDGTAKGGILVALADRYGLPIPFIGIGEGEEDLVPFDAEAFARALIGAP